MSRRSSDLAARATMDLLDDDLTARMEPFDSFWEAPADVESGFARFGRFYAANYLDRMPSDPEARILVVSCGPGYFVDLLGRRGYGDVTGIDSFPEKVEWGRRRGLDCRVARAFGFLRASADPYDVIFCEQEINHLTKDEILAFLGLCRASLRPGGRLVVHSINGAHPFAASEARAGNFDHYNSFTEYSLRQVLEHAGFEDVQVFPLKLFVFWENPLNYVGLAATFLNELFFRLQYALVGKSAKIYTKKIGASGTRPA